MCKYGGHKLVKVKIPADLSRTGKERWKLAKVDMCIAPIVKALQEGGIDMRSSCCGHCKGDGEILLHDGTVLIIKKKVPPWKLKTDPKLEKYMCV
jgi:hypothetical protein